MQNNQLVFASYKTEGKHSSQNFRDRFRIEGLIEPEFENLQSVVRRTNAYDLELDRDVWLHFVDASLLNSEDLFRFRYDTRKLSEIASQHLLVPIEFDTDSEKTYLVTEVAPGYSLNEVDLSSFDVLESLDVVIDTLEGLQLVHEAGIVHRNIQASNIFVNEGKAVLAGVGIERFITLPKIVLSNLYNSRDMYRRNCQALWSMISRYHQTYIRSVLFSLNCFQVACRLILRRSVICCFNI